MFNCIFKWSGYLTAVFLATQDSAQDGSQIAQNRADRAEMNNGINPTLPTTQFGVQYQYNQISSDLNTGLFEAFYTQPFGARGKRAFRITIPGSDSPFNADPNLGGTPGSDFSLGDISVTYIDVFYLTPKTALPLRLSCSWTRLMNQPPDKASWSRKVRSRLGTRFSTANHRKLLM